MGILDKIMFWKKDDEFKDVGLGDKDNLAFGDNFGAGLQTPNTLGSQFGSQQGFGQGSYGQEPNQGYNRYPQSPAFSNPQPSMPSFGPQFPQPRYENPRDDINSKNLEIISSKLDALRASIESLNQRLANLEAIARGEEPGSRRRYY